MSRMKIDSKIVGYAVKKPEKNKDDKSRPEYRREASESGGAEVIRMHEKLERPEMLVGSTYKVKTPISDHAMYVTINDIVLNEGTEHE
ncbi:MAG: NrdJb, partial [Gammaproteobacteria bacterium]|nr:NrdJb [Gammaproteobacteria bacterium]